MKTRNIIAVALFAIIMYGVYQFREWREGQAVKDLGGFELPDVKFTARHIETPDEKLAKLRDMASNVASNHLYSSITGFRRIKFLSCNTLAAEITNWTAIAEAERINQFGGVVADYYELRFYTISGILVAGPDWEKQNAKYDEALARAMGMKTKPTNGWPSLVH